MPNSFQAYRECIEVRNYRIDPVVSNIDFVNYLRQWDRILDEFFVKLFSLLFVCMVNTTLEYTASMFMSGNFNAIHRNSVINELIMSNVK